MRTETSNAPFVTVTDFSILVSNSFSVNVQELNINAGENVAIVGANGAGKTSFLEALLGLRSGATGQILIGGKPLSMFEQNPDLRRGWGCLLQRNSYANAFKVKELITLHTALYGTKSDYLFDRLGLSELLSNTYAKLSGGQRQRVDLYIAAQHKPDLLVLDEPTAGLDRHYSQVLIELLCERAQSAKPLTTIFSSHKPQELNFANRIIAMRDGAIVFNISIPDQLESIVGRTRLDLHFNDTEAARAAHDQLSKDKNMVAIACRDSHIRLFWRDSDIQHLLEHYGKITKNFAFGASQAEDIMSIAVLDHEQS